LVVFIIQNWDAIKAAIGKAAEWINVNIIQPVVGFFTNAMNWISTKVQEGFAFVQSIFMGVNEFLQNIFAKDWTEQFGAFGNVLNAFFVNVENIWNAIKTVFSGIVTFVKSVFAGDWQAAWDGIVGIFSGIWEGIVAYVKVPINAIIGFINGLISGIVGGINLVIGVGLYFRYSCNFQSRSMVQCNRTAGTLISP
jgi:phage-related protein